VSFEGLRIPTGDELVDGVPVGTQRFVEFEQLVSLAVGPLGLRIVREVAETDELVER